MSEFPKDGETKDQYLQRRREEILCLIRQDYIYAPEKTFVLDSLLSEIARLKEIIGTTKNAVKKALDRSDGLDRADIISLENYLKFSLPSPPEQAASHD